MTTSTALINTKLCYGCHGMIALGGMAFSLTQGGKLVGDFHDERCLAGFVSEDLMAAKGEAQAAVDHPDETPKVNKTNIKRALKGLTAGSDSGLDVATKLGQQGVKGICSNVGLCPIAMYLTAYFRRHCFVAEQWIGVAAKKLSMPASALEDVEHPVIDYEQQGDKRFVWVETPIVLREFIRTFDNSDDETFCKLEATNEDRHERAWKKLVA